MRLVLTMVLMLIVTNAGMAVDPPAVNLRCPPVVNLKFDPIKAYAVPGVTVVNRPFGQLGNQPVRQATILPINARIVGVPNTLSTVPARPVEHIPIGVIPMVRYGITSVRTYSSG